MYYQSQVDGVVRVPPKLFAEKLSKAIMAQLKKDYEGNIIDVLGKVIAVLRVEKIGEGIIIPGDGAAYYKTQFTAINYIPEIQEIVEGEIKDIAAFGAFVDFGPFEGLIHISQTMDDFVSFSKQGVLMGKESSRALKIGDKVRARIVAISFKNPTNPKIGLTMRQPCLGKIEWLLGKEEKPKTKKQKKPKVKKK